MRPFVRLMDFRGKAVNMRAPAAKRALPTARFVTLNTPNPEIATLAVG